MPLHYALTDGLVAIVAILCGLALARAKHSAAALGIGLFGLAGLIGTVRITTGLIEPLAMLHKGTSQLGGVAGLVLLLSGTLRARGFSHGFGLSLAMAVLAVMFTVIAPFGGMILFVIMLVIGLGLSVSARHYLGAAGYLLMLLNIALVRQSSYFGKDLSWHIYHLCVAAWLFCAAQSVLRQRQANR